MCCRIYVVVQLYVVFLKSYFEQINYCVLESSYMFSSRQCFKKTKAFFQHRLLDFFVLLGAHLNISPTVPPTSNKITFWFVSIDHNHIYRWKMSQLLMSGMCICNIITTFFRRCVLHRKTQLIYTHKLVSTFVHRKMHTIYRMVLFITYFGILIHRHGVRGEGTGGTSFSFSISCF